MPKLSTLIQNPLFCSVPWVHTEIDVPNNSVRTCPRGTFEMGKFSDGVPVVWTNEKYSKLRQDFMDNIQSDNCIDCASGGDTKTFRSDKNQSFYGRRMLNENSENIISPKSVEVCISNQSNVAPRKSYDNKSTIINGYIANSSALQKYLEPSVNTVPNVEDFRGAFVNAEIVSLLGGEPFMYDGIVDLIDLILEESNGCLRQITIFTNLTYKNQAFLDKLASLKNKVSIVINVHIEGPKSIHDYIRHGSSFDTVVANLKEIALNYRHFRFNAVFGISILNVGYIPEVLDTIHNIQKDSNSTIKFMDTFYSVDNSTILHPSNLPYSVKQEYLNRLMNYNFSGNIITELRTILAMTKNMLTSPPKNSMADFYEYIEAFDAVAGTDYKTIYPELAVGAPSGN